MRCRTCFDVLIADQQQSIDEIVLEKEKTLADAIFEIAKVEVTLTTANTTDFRYVCIKCSQAIQEAYSFVLQIQKVNELVLAYPNNEESTVLDESEIDIPPQADEYQPESSETDFVSDFLSESVNIKVEEMLIPIVQYHNESVYDEVPESNEMVSVKAERESETEIRIEMSQKPKRGRPRKRPENNKNSEDNTCQICGTKFNWQKDLIRHTKQHCMEPELQCEYCDRVFLRKDKLKDHMKTHSKDLFRSSDKTASQVNSSFAKHLYANQKLKSIQCKLCGMKFKKIAALSEHLLLHKDPQSFSFKKGSKMAKNFAANLETQTEDKLKLNICSNIKSNNFSGYYSITNAFGYELGLSDSDETVDDDSDIDTRQSIYKCLICETVFNRKYKILSHAMDAHLNEKWPLRCNVCKSAFVCRNMFRHHKKNHCKNKARKLKCTSCPGKFMWTENSENHQCLNTSNILNDGAVTIPKRRVGRPRKSESEGITQLTNNLQCDQCDKSFIWPKDLTRHMRIHLPDRLKFTCLVCQRKFNRKDNMQAHMKVHGDEVFTDCKKKKLNNQKQLKIQDVDEYLTKPHGCKVIECILCMSKQMRMSDLKAHLIKHQKDDSYFKRWESVEKLAETLYPELGKSLDKQSLTSRIQGDLIGKHYERFYSITNQIGYELDLFSSETETDSESEDFTSVRVRRSMRKSASRYKCELCAASFERKYKIFEHQAQQHNWEDAKHNCVHCGARFVSSQLLVWHQERLCKNALKRFLCKKCPLRFMWKQNLDAHVRTMHTNLLEKCNSNARDPLHCNNCNRTFVMKKDLTRHLLMQTCFGQQDEMIKCLFCKRIFYNKDNLHIHIFRHGISPMSIPTAKSILRANNSANGTKNICCRICNVEFSSIEELRTHLYAESNSADTQHHSFDSPLNYTITNSLGFEMQLDDSETEVEMEGETTGRDAVIRPQYQCAICSLNAKRRYEMAQHQLSMHKYEELPYNCDRCIFRTVSQLILSQHKRSQCYNVDKKFECDICQYKFMWPENLESHKSLCQVALNAKPVNNSQTNSTTAEEITVFRCNHCDCRYTRKDRLNEHIRRNHNPGKAKEKKKKTITRPKVVLEKKFLCTFCGRGLTSASNLIIHIRRHTGEKPFNCDFCTMAFPRSSDLMVHRRKHTGEKPHPCTICHKAFARPYKLILHMRTHTGERPYKCTYCERTFTQSNDLTVHIRRHTGERPYVCNICGESFIQGTALRNHRTMHGHYEMEPIPE